jgi:diguanylate cyclase (GGDEF)-like protein
MEASPDWNAVRNHLGSRKIDVVLLDASLRPERSRESLREIRKLGYQDPIVVLVSSGMESEAIEMMELGATDYVVQDSLGIEQLHRVLAHARNVTVLLREIKEQKRELERLSRIDDLTGLFSRAYFLERFGHEVLRAARYHVPMSVLMIDLDHFKHVNDSYGHLMGDIVLSTSARVIWDKMRETDIAGRYGGEEFCVVLTHTDLNGAKAFAERLRLSIAEVRFPASESDTFGVTCSIGLTQYRSEWEEPLVAIDYADQALYRAKTAGRNQVAVADLEFFGPPLRS